MTDYGIKVKLTTDFGLMTEVTILRNVTEIHYNYNRSSTGGRPKIAFESDIHGTGITRYIDNVLEFETFPETEKAEAF